MTLALHNQSESFMGSWATGKRGFTQLTICSFHTFSSILNQPQTRHITPKIISINIIMKNYTMFLDFRKLFATSLVVYIISPLANKPKKTFCN